MVKFDRYKFIRTYNGGSKKRELEIFKEVQGQKEDGSDCDWIEYRKIFIKYYDDVTLVILSWRALSYKLSILFAIISLFLLLINIYLFITTIIISAIFHGLVLFFKRKIMKDRMEYLDNIDFIIDVIEKQTGMVLSKE